MLIVLQNNPDADGMAAALALRKLANTLKITCTIACSGTIGRAENRALVRYVNLKVREIEDLAPKWLKLIALVDTQPGQRNSSLPSRIKPQIVIDHHPIRPETRKATFFDVRSSYGATSTILYEYLDAASIEPDMPLATALLYGIRSDTQDFGRKAHRADIDASSALYALANKRMLGAIQRGRVPLEYFQLLATALNNARHCGRCIYSGLGVVENADMIAEVADLLLRYEEAEWSLCWGYHGGTALLSVRTISQDLPADRIVRHIVRHKGSGGGHPSMAAGQVPLISDKVLERDRLDRLIARRFLEITGCDTAACRRVT
ncbi:MAG: DHH family phosphoesterase [Planctomycetota bacterium]